MHTISKVDLIHWRGRYGPAWRVILARDFVASSRPSPVSDQLVVDVGRYLRLRDRGSDSAVIAAKAFPQIAQAFRLQQDKLRIDSLRLMILGELDSTEIVARTGLTTPEIGLWMEIFFDVHMSQDPLGWHVTHVVLPELEAGNLQVASNLHVARCGGPHMARSLLDGPTEIPTDSTACAELVLRQIQISSFSMLMNVPQSRQELQKQHMLGMKLMLKLQQNKSAEKQRACRQANEERDHALAERRVRTAEQRAEAAAEGRAAKAQAKADQSAQDEQLLHWHQQQAAAQAEREYADRQARIAASKLLSLPWGNAEQLQGTQRAAAAGAGAAPVPRRSESSRRPGSPSTRAERRARTAPQVVQAAAVAVEAQDSPHPVETLST